ncbi:hypothetical protein OIU85_019841 [Salix viminalis]|uniref:Uncharacterized protein n=1 Tax=Salix viminalis TaxID=40686 RepID=A0A9Q0NI86_SALVM|nr:hypothetical protein OIU85_019841 [Salix viminalis]
MSTKSQAIASLLLIAICSSMLVQTDLAQLPPRDLIQFWSAVTSIPGRVMDIITGFSFLKFSFCSCAFGNFVRLCSWSMGGLGAEKGSWRRPLAMVARACDAIGEEPSVMAPRSLGMMTAILLVEILASNP